eukprot:TRINITY_DN8065_c0_g1_i2.p1 TRINITY_DN8065_c0_g1~~TRINITY_DN8065_c0_g1_i2.p1  ORF type:complete len:269 (+),score=32.06 TRINITY_DN8065_c0_g1_i2:165-971(+)
MSSSLRIATAQPRTVRLPGAPSQGEVRDLYAVKVFYALLGTREYIPSLFEKSPATCRITALTSVLFSFAHLLLQACALRKDPVEEIRTFLFVVSILYTSANAWLAWGAIRGEDYSAAKIFHAAFVYTYYNLYLIIILFCHLEENEVISIICAFFALNLYGWYEVVLCYAMLATYLLAFGEGLARCVLPKKYFLSRRELEYNLYYCKEGAEMCVICMEEYRSEDAVCATGCHRRHVFHEKCILYWIANHPTCPLCKSPMILILIPYLHL